MTGHKEGKFLIFTLDNGKTFRYDLSTGETIGISGKPIKGANRYLAKVSIHNIIDSIEEPPYREFLGWVYNKYGLCLSNFGSLLCLAAKYKGYEQYFSSGLKWDQVHKTSPPFAICPKGLLELVRSYNLILHADLVRSYQLDPSLFHMAIGLPYLSLSAKNIANIFCFRYSYQEKNYWPHRMIKMFGYNGKSLFLYIDRIVTLEAYELIQMLRDFEDTINMSSRISTRYDKYPRNLATTHMIVIRNYNRFKEKYDEMAFQKRLDPTFAWSYKGYLVRVPQSTQDIKDEAAQQNNCVASYINRVICGECQIVFLRDKQMPDKSLVTLEVRGDRVVQAKQQYNQEPTPEQWDIIHKYEIYLKEREMKHAG